MNVFVVGNQYILVFVRPTFHRIGLVSKCKYYTNPKYEYKDFVKLSDLPSSQPKGYQARIVFYAQGTRNAHVILSPTNKPDFKRDNMYEFGMERLLSQL